jgi:coenzyme F420-0:L-glutamate ligase/coenzyme F420-1:gamma-L-glutamate ligase
LDHIEIFPVKGLPLITEGTDIGKLVCEAAANQGTPIREHDIIVVTHVAVSKAEGSVVDLNHVKPSAQAMEIAEKVGKDPRLVEVVLRESKELLRVGPNSLIVETKHGFICANAGVDKSNVQGESNVALLPKNPDASAQKIRLGIKRLTGCETAVIISDTHGRPFRMGEINVAIGVAGLKPIRDRRGEKDLFGYILRVKQTNIADELASAAELVMGQADEGIPVAIIRGYPYPSSQSATFAELIRPKEKDLFR